MKAILKQFNTKEVPTDPKALVDEDVQELAELAGELQSEKMMTQGELPGEIDEDVPMPDDFDNESWVDKVETMDNKENE